jgi:hypothetical protein
VDAATPTEKLPFSACFVARARTITHAELRKVYNISLICIMSAPDAAAAPSMPYVNLGGTGLKVSRIWYVRIIKNHLWHFMVYF